jgi:hypothetical protein
VGRTCDVAGSILDDGCPCVDAMPAFEVGELGSGFTRINTALGFPMVSKRDPILDCEVSELGPAPVVEGKPEGRGFGGGFLCVDDVPDFEGGMLGAALGAEGRPDFEGSMLGPAPGAEERLDFEGRMFGNRFPCVDGCGGNRLDPAPGFEGTHCVDLSELDPGENISLCVVDFSAVDKNPGFCGSSSGGSRSFVIFRGEASLTSLSRVAFRSGRSSWNICLLLS